MTAAHEPIDLDAVEARWRRAGADRSYDETTGCRCADTPHTNALHDLADEDVPAMAAEIKRLREHGVRFNRIAWRTAVAVGDVPDGAEQVTGDPDEQLTRLVAERDRLRKALDAIGHERNEWSRQLADVRDERDTARTQAEAERAKRAEAENTIVRVEALLWEWEQLGKGLGMHGRQLRRALDGGDAEAADEGGQS